MFAKNVEWNTVNPSTETSTYPAWSTSRQQRYHLPQLCWKTFFQERFKGLYELFVRKSLMFIIWLIMSSVKLKFIDSFGNILTLASRNSWNLTTEEKQKYANNIYYRLLCCKNLFLSNPAKFSWKLNNDLLSKWHCWILSSKLYVIFIFLYKCKELFAHIGMLIMYIPYFYIYFVKIKKKY